MKLIRKVTKFRDDFLSIESGLLAPRANGAVVVRYKNSIVLVTVSSQMKSKEVKPFLQLTVDFIENFYASGKIPGSFNRREGKPSMNATLSARVIDRSIRPLFDKGFRGEAHVVASVLSYDKTINPAVLATIGASSALLISDLPFSEAIGATTIVNQEIDLIVSATEKNVVMVEAIANEIPESKTLEYINESFEEIKNVIKIQKEFAQEIGKEKIRIRKDVEVEVSINELYEIVEELKCKTARDKAERVQEMIDDFIEMKYGNEDESIKINASASCNEIIRSAIRKTMINTGERVDGRKADEIREIAIVLDLLPMAHGSALFQRGKTQSLGTTTLGSMEDKQLIDDLETEFKKRFFLHYNFPPYSTGEAGFMRSPGRRELGHGNLAERAILAVLPSEESFPYTIRIVTDVLSSNGSSSMASVCSASLSLMSAGVPIKSAVAGIAMGLVVEPEGYMILTDITGFEDGVGDMDFKVAGTTKGITALQMDVKKPCLDDGILSLALEKAKEARFTILDKMNEIISSHKTDLPEIVPRYTKINIDPSKIAYLIGPSGKNIKSIIEATNSSIDIDDSGVVSIFANDAATLKETVNMIKSMVKDVEVGDIFEVPVKKVISSGLFFQISKGRDGFMHISQVANRRLENLDMINAGDMFKVQVENIDPANNKIKLRNLTKKDV